MSRFLHRILGWVVLPVVVLLVIAAPVTVFLLGALLPLLMAVVVPAVILGRASSFWKGNNMGIPHRITWRLRQMVRQALRMLRGVWAAHRQLLRTTRAYEAAVAAAAAQMIIQTSWQRFITALISGLLDIYAAIRRATGPSAGPVYGWDMP